MEKESQSQLLDMEAAGIGPKALPVIPQGCRVTFWWGVCHLVGTERGPEHRE